MDDAALKGRGEYLPVVLDTRALINGHMLFAGMSGMGKSYQIARLLAAVSRQGVGVDVFDPHEELDGVPGSVAVKFSEATRAGYNPLELSLDPHSGGVRRQISLLIDMINRTSRSLGPRQETALRNLLMDVYRARGIDADDASTWRRASLRESQFYRMIQERDYSGLKNYYPILQDVLSYAERKLKALTLGSDFMAVNALEKVERSASRIQAIQTKYRKADSDEEVERLQTQLAAEKVKAIEAYTNFINAIETGREYQDALKYTNKDTLISVVERLQALLHCGIMRSNPPEWGGANVRVHKVGSLSDDDRKLLFFTRAQAILRECMDAGKSDDVRRMILVDEGHLYYSEDGDNPLNRIAKEGRKFGLSLVVGSQSPTHFSEDFLTNCGSIFLLGIHENYWPMAVNKLNLTKAQLSAVRAQEVLLAKLRMKGSEASQFVAVNVSQPTVDAGLRHLMSA